MVRMSIRWLLGELPRLEAEGAIGGGIILLLALRTGEVPIHRWLADNASSE
jgi:hypothetical protein